MLLIGYINVPASIVMMLGGFLVFTVAIMSIMFLKRKLYRHHWTGLFLILSGIGMVAIAALSKNKHKSEGSPVLGFAMVIGSLLLQGVQFIVEEKLLGSYYLNPLKVVGWEGMTGTILFSILLPILQNIH